MYYAILNSKRKIIKRGCKYMGSIPAHIFEDEESVTIKRVPAGGVPETLYYIGIYSVGRSKIPLYKDNVESDS